VNLAGGLGQQGLLAEGATAIGSSAMATDSRADPIGSAHRGENPLVMARMRSGFAVIGDTQHLPGYSLLLTDDPSVNHLTDLAWEGRREFLFDLALLGEAVERVCRPHGLRRINYEVLGNSWPVLHGHVHARYEWEPPDKISGPVWDYPKDVRDDPAHAYSDKKHGELRAAITAELTELIRQAY
jgi:diadenosine tetraphosphate (Ap4A) HIT family hydrolase